MKSLIKFLLLGGFILLLITPCSKTTDPDDSGNLDSIEDLINSAGGFEAIQYKNEVDSSYVLQTINNQSYYVKSKNYSCVFGPDNHPNFDRNTDIIFPGNLLQGQSLSGSNPTQIVVNRAGGTVTLDLLIGSGEQGLTEEVPVMNYSNVMEAMRNILAGVSDSTVLPADFNFSKSEVQSKEQLALELNASYENLTFDVQTSLKFSTDKEYNRYFIKLTQSYFTFVYNKPTSLDQVFAPGVTADDLIPYIYPGNPPAYISSVTVGRIFYFLLESTSSKTEMEASINASFSAAISQGSISSNVKYLSELNEVNISCYAVGGESNLALAAAMGDFEALKTFVAEGGNPYTGKPLSYKVNSLANHETVFNKVASDYTVKEYFEVDPYFWYRADSLVTVSDDTVVTTWGNAFENPIISNTATGKRYRALNKVLYVNDPQRYQGPILKSNRINGKPAIVTNYYRNQSDDYWFSSFEYHGDHFANSDYTIFAVVRLLEGDHGYFLWTWHWDYDKLKIGFNSQTSFEVKHWHPQYVNCPVTHYQQFLCYTVNFSQQEGIIIREGGVQKLQNQSWQSPVSENVNAMIGFGPHYTGISKDLEYAMEIAELKAYLTALPVEICEIEENALKDKYGL